MEISRKTNSMKSILSALSYNILRIVLQFIFRSVLIYYLGITYLGVNSAVTSLLNLLSVTELGFSSVITFNLYQPVHENNTEKINSIINFYRKVYIVVGCIVMAMGLALLPFLNVLISDYNQININVELIYILSLASTVVSYFCSYRNVLFVAFQEQYKSNILNTGLYLFNYALQILAVTVFKNYIIYLIVTFVLTILNNLVTYFYTIKIYPKVKVKNASKLSKEDKSSINANIKGMIYHKLSYAVIQGTDSIVISSFIGATILGIYSNYSIFTTNLIMIFAVIASALAGSVGNLHASGETEQSYKVYKYLKLAFFWLAGFCSISLFVLLNPTIKIWSLLGNWDQTVNWQFDMFTVTIICVNFYIYTSRIITGTFRESVGMFEKDRYKGLVEAAINVIVSLLLVKPLGIAGVLIGTIVSCLCTSIWVDPYMAYKYNFKKPLRLHFKDLALYTLITLIVGFATSVVCHFIPDFNLWWYILKVVVCVVLTNILFLLFYFKTKEFKDIMEIVKKFFRNKFKSKEKQTENLNVEKTPINDKPKILCICHKMALGGVCIAVNNFIDNMKNDCDIELVLALEGGELENRIPENVRVKFIGYPLQVVSLNKKQCRKKGLKYFLTKMVVNFLNKFFGMGRPILKLFTNLTKIEKTEYDLVINNDMDLTKRGLGSCHPYAKKAKAKVKVFVLHGDFEANNYDKKFFKKEYLPVYDKIISLSEAQTKRMKEIFPDYAEKFITITNFEADKEIIEMSKQEKIDFDKNKINFVAVSRLTELKGYIRTFKALARLKDEGYDFCFHILGDGEQKQELEEFIKNNNLSENIKLLGYKKNPYPYMRCADFLTLLSYHESYGLVVIESLICNTPVCMTNTIAAEEMITHHKEGVICDNTDDGVYAGLKDMFENFKTYKKNVKDYKFDNESIKRAYEDLIDGKK